MLKFFAEKMWVALLTFFQQKNIRILYTESAKTVNEMTLNELVKLTTLWTTGPSETTQLAHCRRNRLPHSIHWKSAILNLGILGYVI